MCPPLPARSLRHQRRHQSLQSQWSMPFPPRHSQQPWLPRPCCSCFSRTHPARSLGPFCTVICPPVRLNSRVGPSETLRTTSPTPPNREGKETDWAESRASPAAAELEGLWAPPFRGTEALGLSGGLVRVPLRSVAHARPALAPGSPTRSLIHPAS